VNGGSVPKAAPTITPPSPIDTDPADSIRLSESIGQLIPQLFTEVEIRRLRELGCGWSA
jgi:hypothetical protein